MNADFLSKEFSKVRKNLPGSKFAQVSSARESALQLFSRQGYPTTKLEEWRFTNMDLVSKNPFMLAERAPVPNGSPSHIAESVMAGSQAHVMVFVNGFFAQELSRLAGCAARVENLRETLDSAPESLNARLIKPAHRACTPFALLNEVFFSDGALIRVPDNVTLSEPLHLVWLTVPGNVPAVQYPKTVLILGQNAHAKIVETYLSVSDGFYFTNAVSDIFMDSRSSLEHYRVQRESKIACHAGCINVAQGQESQYRSFSLSAGGAIARVDLQAVLDGEGADCSLDGLYATHGTQHVDNHTAIVHAKPHGTSRELYKGILRDQSRAVFHGRIQVQPDAQKTNAVQHNKNLMLSDQSWVHTQPELKIFANDVKCKHGATIGQMDTDMLFYLRSRGIPEPQAKNILVHAFASEMIDSIKVDTLRQGLACLLTVTGT